MTSAILTDLEKAAIPTAISVLQAAQGFANSIGNDPTKYALTVPAAFNVFVGTLELQLPSLAQAEGATVISIATSRISSWISTLQSKLAVPAGVATLETAAK